MPFGARPRLSSSSRQSKTVWRVTAHGGAWLHATNSRQPSRYVERVCRLRYSASQRSSASSQARALSPSSVTSTMSTLPSFGV